MGPRPKFVSLTQIWVRDSNLSPGPKFGSGIQIWGWDPNLGPEHKIGSEESESKSCFFLAPSMQGRDVIQFSQQQDQEGGMNEGSSSTEQGVPEHPPLGDHRYYDL